MYRRPHAPAAPDYPADEVSARRDALIRRAEESRQPFEPEVALFLDDTTASAQARQMFEAAQIPFRTLPATGPDIPAAVFGGMRFVGNDNIRELVRTLKAIEAIFVTGQGHAAAPATDAGIKPSKHRSNKMTEQPTTARRAKSA